MKFPATHKLLNNPYVFNADTAATSHMTSHVNGLINKVELDGLPTQGSGKVDLKN
jgi:hypothetical protein